jgi:hypothetical protein
MSSTNGFSRRLAAPIAAVSLATAGLVAVTSAALFTGSDDAAGSFTTGTVDINNAPATAAFTVPNMAPGDTEFATIAVENDGSLEMRYSMETTNTTTKALASQMTMEVKSGTGITETNFASTGTTLYSGPISGAAGKVFGDKAQGNQTGDRILAAGGQENLYILVTLDLAADDAYETANTTATFTFDAEQTANND